MDKFQLEAQRVIAAVAANDVITKHLLEANLLTERHKQIILDALKMAEASNNRMQNSKPQFKEVFDRIAFDISETIQLIRAFKPVDTNTDNKSKNK